MCVQREIYPQFLKVMHKPWINIKGKSIYGIENMFCNQITANTCAYVYNFVDKQELFNEKCPLYTLYPQKIYKAC